MPFLMGEVAYHPEDPNLFYCWQNCDQPGQESLGSFWLDHRNGEFNHNPAHMKFYGWAGISWQGAQYEAVSLMIGEFSLAFIYKTQDGQISPLLDVADLSELIEPGSRIRLEPYILNDVEMTGWNDINADGLPEILFWAGHGGSGPCHPVMMVQIQRDGNLSQIPLPECTIAVHDVDHDGNAEAITLHPYSATLPACGNAARCDIRKIYVWDGSRYVEADHQKFAHYYLEALFEVVDDVSFSNLYRLEEIIYVYRLIERPEEGLHVFDAYTNPACYDESARAELLRLRKAYDLPSDHRACAIVRQIK